LADHVFEIACTLRLKRSGAACARARKKAAKVKATENLCNRLSFCVHPFSMKGFVREKCRSRGFRRSGIVRRIPPFSQLIRTFSRTIRAEPPHFDGMGCSDAGTGRFHPSSKAGGQLLGLCILDKTRPAQI